MDKRMIGVQLADLTKEREERLRKAVSDKGFEMKVLQKGSGYDPMELSDCEILFGNFPPSELKLAKELRWHATASAGIDQYVDESIYDHEGILLTNSSGVDGACAMLYPDVLKNFAAYLKKDLIILPSSVHEVLLVPDQSCLSANQLTDMILQANEEVVSVQERLSDHAYRYCRQTDTVVCLPSCSCKSLS